MACGSTPRNRSSTRRPNIIDGSPGGARRGGRTRRDLVAENEPQEPVWSGRATMVDTGSTRYGTTTSITRAASPPTGRDEAYFSGLPRRRAGIRVDREIRIPLSGTVVSRGRGSPRHAGARSRRRRSSSPSRRTTIRSRTTAGGRRMHQETSPGALPRAYGADAPPAADPDAVSGAGVRRVGAVSLFRRSHAPTCCAVREGRTNFVVAVPELCRDRPRGARRRSDRSGDVRAVQAGLERAQDRTRERSPFTEI